VLLGRTVDTGRVWDIVATARYLKKKYEANVPVFVAGEGPPGVLAAYAALWEPEIDGVTLDSPPLTHMAEDAPQLLNVLRVCDIPEILGMLAPRPLRVWNADSSAVQKVTRAYAAADASEKCVFEKP
jgi:hypothetical protein